MELRPCKQQWIFSMVSWKIWSLPHFRTGKQMKLWTFDLIKWDTVAELLFRRLCPMSLIMMQWHCRTLLSFGFCMILFSLSLRFQHYRKLCRWSWTLSFMHRAICQWTRMILGRSIGMKWRDFGRPAAHMERSIFLWRTKTDFCLV